MNTALLSRLAWAVFVTALLCGIAACTRDPERADTAAASAPPTAAKPDSLTAQIARDAALSDALIGTWAETNTRSDGVARHSVVRYAADRTFTAMVMRVDKPDDRHTAKGTWSVAQGFLTYRWTLDAGPDEQQGSDEILRLDQRELVYIDSDTKKTRIAARAPDTTLADAAAPAPQAAFASAPVLPPAVAAAPPGDTPFFDDTLFVANEDVQTHVFRLDEAVQVRLSIDIEARVPVNLVVQHDEIAPEAYLMTLGVLTASQVMAMFDSSGEKTSTNDLFRNRLSKRAAYGRFDSPWVSLKPGAYTVILDNSGQLSPSRGDAPVHLRLYSRPIP